MAPFNPVVVLPPRDPAAAFERVRAFYARTSVAGEVNASGDTARAIAEVARTAGFVSGHSIPCLVLAPLAGTRPAAPGLEVRHVDDAAALMTFNDVCAEAFGLYRPILAIFDDPRMLELPGFGTHLWMTDGLATATAMTVCIDDVVLIFNVATLRSHRRRGIGEAMTWCAVNHGIKAGCDLAFLQSSAAGRPLYDRLGFRHGVDMQTWSFA